MADDGDMLALSIRQPFAELILRGLKTIEYRSRSTNIVGQRFYIYACKRKWPSVGGETSASSVEAWPVKSADNIAVPDVPPGSPERSRIAAMIALANSLKLFPHELPMGVIVGSAIIEKVTQQDKLFEWHLRDVRRMTSLRKPERHPQPVWFEPFIGKQ